MFERIVVSHLVKYFSVSHAWLNRANYYMSRYTRANFGSSIELNLALVAMIRELGCFLYAGE